MSSVEILSKTDYVKTEPGNNNILCKMNSIYNHLFSKRLNIHTQLEFA